MCKFLGFFVCVFFLALPLAAQDYNDGQDEAEPYFPEIDSDWDGYDTDPYVRGDKNFTITMGALFPTIFTGYGMKGNPHNIGVGGTGALSYDHFFNAHIFMGVEVSGMFASTVRKNMLYIIPFGVRFGYQFIINRFEIPVMFMAGAAPQKYMEKNYFGLFLKPAISGFFRYNPDWSFGMNLQWWMLPQWPKYGNDVFGNFLEVTLSARYHF